MTFWRRRAVQKPYPTQNGMKASAIGEKARKAQQWEQAQAKVLEGTSDRLGLFQLHHVDYLHLSAPMRDTGTLKAGHPDYLIIGDSPKNHAWMAFLEIKARNMETGRLGRLSAAQRTFHAKLIAAGAEVWTAYLPDDLQAVNLWLREKTGVVCEVQL